MDGEGEHRWVVGENFSRAVALVYVAVEQEHPLGQSFGLSGSGGYRHIVEDAKAGAAVGPCVVGAAGQVDANAFAKGRPHSGQRAANGTMRPFDHPGRPREANAADLLGRQLSSFHSAQVFNGVHPKKFLVGSPRGFMQLIVGQHSLRSHPTPQLGILGHWEAMAGRKRQHEGVGVKCLHLKDCTLDNINLGCLPLAWNYEWGELDNPGFNHLA